MPWQRPSTSLSRPRLKFWPWCKRPSGFPDRPLWGTIADEAGVHVNHVRAFIDRLEDLANKSTPRGSLADYIEDEFARALEIALDKVRAVRAALEKFAVIEQDCLVEFALLNCEEGDRTANERQQRRRDKLDKLKKEAAAAVAESCAQHVTRDSVTVTRDESPAAHA